MAAAMGAECANDQGKFWQMHDKLFENPKALSDDNITSYAKPLSSTWASLASATRERSTRRKLEAAVFCRSAWCPRYQHSSSTTFLSGAQPFPSFKTLIDEELAKAKKSGIAKKDY